jgi:hypothetical protein
MGWSGGGELSSSEGRSGPTARSATSEATARLATLTDQVESTAPKAAFARNREIRIDKRDRVVVATALEVTRHGITIVTGALLLALVLCLGWIGELNFISRQESRCRSARSCKIQPTGSARFVGEHHCCDNGSCA